LKRAAALLIKGATDPDNFSNFPHHQGKNLEIALNILEARIMYLESNDECYYHLGQALHYIQDKWTLRPRIADAHTRWEQEIDHFGQSSEASDMTLAGLEEKLIHIPKKYADFYRFFWGMDPPNFLFLTICERCSGQVVIRELPCTNSPNPTLFIQRTTQESPTFNTFQLFDSAEAWSSSLGKGWGRVAIPAEVRVISFANLGHPTDKYSTPALDYMFACYFSLVVTSYVLLSTDERKWLNLYYMQGIDDKNRWFEPETLRWSLGYLKSLSSIERARYFVEELLTREICQKKKVTSRMVGSNEPASKSLPIKLVPFRV